MLGLSGGIRKPNAFYGSNPDIGIVLDDIWCRSGYETSLNQCSFTMGHNCQHSQDAGVECIPAGRFHCTSHGRARCRAAIRLA